MSVSYSESAALAAVSTGIGGNALAGHGSGARGTGWQVLGAAEGYDDTGGTLRAGGGNIERLAGEPLRVYWLAVGRSEGRLWPVVV